MKKILTFTVLLIAALSISNIANAQSLKFGHIDTGVLFEMMPEKDKAYEEIEAYRLELTNALTAMQTEGEKKYNDLVASADSLSPLIRQSKEAEIQEISQRIQQFQQQAQQDLAKKEGELMQPIYDKIKNAIKDVANENGYIYVFETGALLHIGDQSEDILPLVKVKLGIQ